MVIAPKRWWFLGTTGLFIILSVLGMEDPRCADEHTTGPRVAIAFYGLSRSLKTTLPSIERHIFDILYQQGVAYDVFWSGMHTSFLDNKRSGEEHVPLDAADFTLMRPCVLSIVSQSIIIPSELKQYKQARVNIPDDETVMFQRDQQSVQNLLAAFRSLRTALSMITRYSRTRNITYDAVVVFRSDTAIVSDIDISKNLPLITGPGSSVVKSIWVPDFQHWDGYNDRAAYGSPRVMSTYMTRGNAFRDRTGGGNSSFRNGELFLKMYLNHHDITVHSSALRVVRVRADGSVAHKDTIQMQMNMDDAAYQRYTQNCLYYKMKKVPCRTFMCDWLEPPKWERVDETAYFNSAHC